MRLWRWLLNGSAAYNNVSIREGIIYKPADLHCSLSDLWEFRHRRTDFLHPLDVSWNERGRSTVSIHLERMA
jgi:hypothetical protein